MESPKGVTEIVLTLVSTPRLQSLTDLYRESCPLGTETSFITPFTKVSEEEEDGETL